MKTFNSLINAIANAHQTSVSDVTDGIRALLDYLMEDPEFRSVWEALPNPDALSDEELLLAVMIAGEAEDARA